MLQIFWEHLFYGCLWSDSFNSFHATGLFSCLLKTSETLWFSDVFRGYQKSLVAWNGLIKIWYLLQKEQNECGHPGIFNCTITFWSKCSQIIFNKLVFAVVVLFIVLAIVQVLAPVLLSWFFKLCSVI